MNSRARRALSALSLVVLFVSSAAASAYNARPKLVVIIVVDQFRGDYLERNRDHFVEGGFRMLMDRGANFTDCYYDYANTRTAPGHATIGTGAYTNGNGIGANAWWTSGKKTGDGTVSSVEDAATKMVGPDAGATGSSPHNLLASTLADELRLATHGIARTFGVALKDRAAILPIGYSGNAAYWIDHTSGQWQSSTYYMNQLPAWAAAFNRSGRNEKYWGLEWKDADGKVIATTNHRNGKKGPLGFYEVVGATRFGNDYELEFARELVEQEKLGQGDTTDLLVVSLSSFDIVGHQVGPDSPVLQEMTLATDRQLADFFGFLGRQVGLANLWIALTADHGVGPLPEQAQKLHIPAYSFSVEEMVAPLNQAIAQRLNRPGKKYVPWIEWPYVFLDSAQFPGMKEEEAEKVVGEALAGQRGVRSWWTRAQLGRGDVPHDEYGREFLHSYIPKSEWYTMIVTEPFAVDWVGGADHFAPWSYDRHVPLLLFGLPFQPGTYRTHAEPVDLAVTFSSLLGLNKPSHAVGRVLTESLKKEVQ